ncbi:MAG: hypothetical protein GXO18_03820 [Aquificae bacterium]|nr:hypothetical protein [Aquificota bacterium]
MFLILLVFFFSLSFGSEVVARIDGRVITKEEFRELFKFYWREMIHRSPGNPTEEDKRRFLFELIKGIIVEESAREAGVVVTGAEVERALRKWGRKKVSPLIRELVRRELYVDKMTDRITKGVKVSEGEIEAYYLLNKREFYYPNQVKLLRVLVDTSRKAEEVYQLLKEGKRVYSGNGVRVGRERWYSLQALPRKVRRKLHPYKVGSVSKPIRLETGYLILKITDKRKAGVLPLSEVRDIVRAKLLKEKKQEVFREWFRETLKRYRLEIYLKHL